MAVPKTIPLAQVLESLSGLAGRSELDALGALQDRAQTRRLRVLVAGEAKRGKSTLVNRLLGVDLLPTGVVPVTAIATTVRRDRHMPDVAARVRVAYQDHRQVEVGLEALAALVTEQQNPGNEKCVAGVEIVLGPGDLDEYDVELVDTPGTGSIFEHSTTIAHQAYDTLDAAIFVVNADPPISAAERDLLREVAQRAVRTLVFLNKADQLSAADLEVSIAFTRGVCQEATGLPVALFAGSARTGPADPGYSEFAAAFQRYLAESAAEDVERSLVAHARRLASGLLDATRLAQRSQELMAAGSRDRVTAFADRLSEVRRQLTELEDHGWAMERGLRRGLDAAAQTLRQELTRSTWGQLTAALDGPLAALPPVEMEERARALIVDTIVRSVSPWREGQAAGLDSGLQNWWRRVIAEHERTIAELRDAARELLDLELSSDAGIQRLAVSRGFWFMFDRPPNVELPFAGLARRIAPGHARRLRQQILGELAQTVDRQVGRARADLQERLQEGMRALLAELRHTQEQLLGRLQSALDEADVVWRSSARGEKERLGTLSLRASRLEELLDELSDLSAQ